MLQPLLQGLAHPSIRAGSLVSRDAHCGSGLAVWSWSCHCPAPHTHVGSSSCQLRCWQVDLLLLARVQPFLCLAFPSVAKDQPLVLLLWWLLLPPCCKGSATCASPLVAALPPCCEGSATSVAGFSLFPCCKGSATSVAGFSLFPCCKGSATSVARCFCVPLLQGFSSCCGCFLCFALFRGSSSFLFLARTLGLVALLACLALVVVPCPFCLSLGLAQLFGSGGRPPWHSRGALSTRATLNSKAFGPYHNRLPLRARF